MSPASASTAAQRYIRSAAHSDSTDDDSPPPPTAQSAAAARAARAAPAGADDQPGPPVGPPVSTHRKPKAHLHVGQGTKRLVVVRRRGSLRTLEPAAGARTPVPPAGSPAANGSRRPSLHHPEQPEHLPGQHQQQQVLEVEVLTTQQHHHPAAPAAADSSDSDGFVRAPTVPVRAASPADNALQQLRQATTLASALINRMRASGEYERASLGSHGSSMEARPRSPALPPPDLSLARQAAARLSGGAGAVSGAQPRHAAGAPPLHLNSAPAAGDGEQSDSSDDPLLGVPGYGGGGSAAARARQRERLQRSGGSSSRREPAGWPAQGAAAGAPAARKSRGWAGNTSTAQAAEQRGVAPEELAPEHHAAKVRVRGGVQPTAARAAASNASRQQLHGHAANLRSGGSSSGGSGGAEEDVGTQIWRQVREASRKGWFSDAEEDELSAATAPPPPTSRRLGSSDHLPTKWVPWQHQQQQAAGRAGTAFHFPVMSADGQARAAPGAANDAARRSEGLLPTRLQQGPAGSLAERALLMDSLGPEGRLIGSHGAGERGQGDASQVPSMRTERPKGEHLAPQPTAAHAWQQEQQRQPTAQLSQLPPSSRARSASAPRAATRSRPAPRGLLSRDDLQAQHVSEAVHRERLEAMLAGLPARAASASGAYDDSPLSYTTAVLDGVDRSAAWEGHSRSSYAQASQAGPPARQPRYPATQPPQPGQQLLWLRQQGPPPGNVAPPRRPGSPVRAAASNLVGGGTPRAARASANISLADAGLGTPHLLHSTPRGGGVAVDPMHLYSLRASPPSLEVAAPLASAVRELPPPADNVIAPHRQRVAPPNEGTHVSLLLPNHDIVEWPVEPRNISSQQAAGYCQGYGQPPPQQQHSEAQVLALSPQPELSFRPGAAPQQQLPVGGTWAPIRVVEPLPYPLFHDSRTAQGSAAAGTMAGDSSSQAASASNRPAGPTRNSSRLIPVKELEESLRAWQQAQQPQQLQPQAGGGWPQAASSAAPGVQHPMPASERSMAQPWPDAGAPRPAPPIADGGPSPMPLRNITSRSSGTEPVASSQAGGDASEAEQQRLASTLAGVLASVQGLDQLMGELLHRAGPPIERMAASAEDVDSVMLASAQPAARTFPATTAAAAAAAAGAVAASMPVHGQTAPLQPAATPHAPGLAAVVSYGEQGRPELDLQPEPGTVAGTPDSGVSPQQSPSMQRWAPSGLQGDAAARRHTEVQRSRAMSPQLAAEVAALEARLAALRASAAQQRQPSPSSSPVQAAAAAMPGSGDMPTPGAVPAGMKQLSLQQRVLEATLQGVLDQQVREQQWQQPQQQSPQLPQQQHRQEGEEQEQEQRQQLLEARMASMAAQLAPLRDTVHAMAVTVAGGAYGTDASSGSTAPATPGEAQPQQGIEAEQLALAQATAEAQLALAGKLQQLEASVGVLRSSFAALQGGSGVAVPVGRRPAAGEGAVLAGELQALWAAVNALSADLRVVHSAPAAPADGPGGASAAHSAPMSPASDGRRSADPQATVTAEAAVLQLGVQVAALASRLEAVQSQTAAAAGAAAAADAASTQAQAASQELQALAARTAAVEEAQRQQQESAPAVAAASEAVGTVSAAAAATSAAAAAAAAAVEQLQGRLGVVEAGLYEVRQAQAASAAAPAEARLPQAAEQQLGELQQQVAELVQQHQLQGAQARADQLRLHATTEAAVTSALAPLAARVAALEQRLPQLAAAAAAVAPAAGAADASLSDADSAQLPAMQQLSQDMLVAKAQLDWLIQQLSRLSAAADAAPGGREGVAGRLAALESRLDLLSSQLGDVAATTTLVLPQRLAAVEARVQATAQTCADAVKVIATKHQAISAVFGEIQAGQLALDGQLQRLGAAVKQLQERRNRREWSRGGGASSSAGSSSHGSMKQ